MSDPYCKVWICEDPEAHEDVGGYPDRHAAFWAFVDQFKEAAESDPGYCQHCIDSFASELAEVLGVSPRSEDPS